MKPPPFRYERPESLEQALGLLAEHGDEAKVLAGGQSLVPLLSMRFARPAVLVDVNRLPGLDAVTAVNGHVRAGALARQNAFGAAPLVRALLPLAAEAVPHIGHVATRNRGTVGGSIAHADARAELPLVLAALGGGAVLASVRGRRELGAADLFVTHFTAALEPDELLVETVWPAAVPGSGHAFEELGLRAGDFALGMAACVLKREAGRVAGARVTVGAVTDRPTPVPEAETLLEGEAVGPELAREAGRAAALTVDPADSLHASAAYQRHLTGLLVERAVLRAWQAAG
ncbi:MAG: FAD binding domain-containing protein [Thermoleophilia bacterium]|nr:FAD binding domain-containing protein [Thermoleophilia bacterium]